MSDVFIAFQHNEESRVVIDAIVADNPNAVLTHPTGLVKVTGRPYDLQAIHVNLVTLSGHIDEDDDQLTLSWKH